MGPAFIFQIIDLNKKFGQRELLKNINLAFYPGAKIGLLGRNGAGKSTLMKIMAGIDREYDGEARLAEGYTVGYLEQEPKLDPNKTVFENVMDAVDHSRAVLRRFEEINARLGEPLSDGEMEKLLAEQATVQDEIDAKNLWDLDRQVEIAMDAMNLPPGDWGVTNLSGGERRRVALCKLLLEKPDLLLLDEPTNHLDAESVNWLERHLAEYTGTVVAVTHDRYFLDNVAKWILEVDHGRGIPFEGNYSSWLEQKKSRLELEEKQASARQKTLDKELEWVRMSPKARQAKSKARLAAYEKLAAEQAAVRDQDIEIFIPASRPLGDQVIDVEKISKAFGDKLLFENLSFKLPPRGPESRRPRPRQVGVRGDLGRSRHHRARQAGGERPQLRGEVQLHGAGSAEEGGHALRRRAEQGAPRQAAPRRGEPAPARRAHQRPRRGYPAVARGGYRELRGVGGGDHARPLVSRPAGHAHHRLRGRRLRARVRG